MYEQIDFFQYIYGISMEQADFMLNEEHEVRYNEVCMACGNACKQSHKCQIIVCPRFEAQGKGHRRRTRRKVLSA